MNNFFTWSCVRLDCKVQNVTYSVHVQLYILLSRYWIKHNYCKLQTKLLLLVRAVKKFLSSRLIMNSRRLWNLYQRHKFLRAEASRDILKFKVSKMAFPGVFKMYFPPWMPSGFLRIHACHWNVPGIPRNRTVPTFCLSMGSMSFKTGRQMLYNNIGWCLFFVISNGRRRWK